MRSRARRRSASHHRPHGRAAAGEARLRYGRTAARLVQFNVHHRSSVVMFGRGPTRT
jgi:hypothetical protein